MKHLVCLIVIAVLIPTRSPAQNGVDGKVYIVMITLKIYDYA